MSRQARSDQDRVGFFCREGFLQVEKTAFAWQAQILLRACECWLIYLHPGHGLNSRAL
jgi:hypothetical protein